MCADNNYQLRRTPTTTEHPNIAQAIDALSNCISDEATIHPLGFCCVGNIVSVFWHSKQHTYNLKMCRLIKLTSSIDRPSTQGRCLFTALRPSDLVRWCHTVWQLVYNNDAEERRREKSIQRQGMTSCDVVATCERATRDNAVHATGAASRQSRTAGVSITPWHFLPSPGFGLLRSSYEFIFHPAR